MPIDLTYIQLPLSTIEAIEKQIAEGYASRVRKSGTQQLSQLTSQLGVVEAGEIRLGNGVFPGSGFSGLRLGYPTFTYNGAEWNLVGIENDVLQVGIRASDGKFLAGDGDVRIDDGGITFPNTAVTLKLTDSIKWVDFNIPETLLVTIGGTKEYTSATDFSGQLYLETKGAGSGGKTEKITLRTEGGASIVLSSFLAGGASKSVIAFEVSSSFQPEFVFNDTGIDSDFRIESPEETHLFFLKGTSNAIAIGHNSPQARLDINGDLRVRGFADLIEATAPGTPASGYGRFYIKTDSLPYFKDDSGTEFGLTGSGFINLGDGSELTISGGEITATNSYHRVDTESDDSSDNLDTITGGVNGDLLLIRAATNGRTIVVRNNQGNLNLDSAGDFSLNHVRDTILLVSRSGAWLEVSRSNNG